MRCPNCFFFKEKQTKLENNRLELQGALEIFPVSISLMVLKFSLEPWLASDPFGMKGLEGGDGGGC